MRTGNNTEGQRVGEELIIEGTAMAENATVAIGINRVTERAVTAVKPDLLLGFALLYLVMHCLGEPHFAGGYPNKGPTVSDALRVFHASWHGYERANVARRSEGDCERMAQLSHVMRFCLCSFKSARMRS